MEPAVLSELRVGLKAAGEVVAADARKRAPVRSGALQASVKPRTSGARVGVGSRLPYANVIHWGGNVPSKRSTSHRPKRHFRARPFISQAIEATYPEFIETMAGNIDALARRHGWH